MKFYEVQTSIDAPAGDVWAIITDGPGLATWESGIERCEGAIVPGGRIKLFTEVSPGRAFPLKVTVFEAPRLLRFEGGMPLGLFRGRRTYTLTESDGATQFHMREEFTGPLVPLIWRTMPDLQPSFDTYARGLKAHAEARAKDSA